MLRDAAARPRAAAQGAPRRARHDVPGVQKRQALLERAEGWGRLRRLRGDAFRLDWFGPFGLSAAQWRVTGSACPEEEFR